MMLPASQTADGAGLQGVHAAASQALPSDALELLRTDHRGIDTLLQEALLLSEGSSADRSGLVAQVGALLNAHLTTEEELFYPLLPGGAGTAPQQHDDIRDRLKALSAPDLSAADFTQRLTSLTQAVHDHEAHEESHWFPQAQSFDLHALGARMAVRRGQLLGPQGMD